ncbi:MAG TPA: NAD(P)-binding protein [Vicinamibacteria bacterium]
MTNKRDLGLERSITRRDFLNGVALTVGGSLVPAEMAAALAFDLPPGAQDKAGYYPPALTGLRGSHEGSFEAAHEVKDGGLRTNAGAPTPDDETYDLVVVGAGLSGLASACLYRKEAGPGARILVLDNHDDFGGHAKRNEFRQGGSMRLAHGGTFAIDSPAPYRAFAKSFIHDLGIDVGKWAVANDRAIFSSRGLERGLFFDKETFGRDALTANPLERDRRGQSDRKAAAWKRFRREAPLSDGAKRDLERLLFERKDYLPGLSSAEKKARLARISYADYLTKVASASPEIVKVLQSSVNGLYGAGIDIVPAQDAWGLGLPGFVGLGLDGAPGAGMNRDAIPSEEAHRYFFHFPDGNASVARLMVRRLVPAAVPGSTAEDVVTARVDYARLDEPGSATRLRLNSTVVRVSHDGPADTAREVEVTYVREGRMRTVRARSCILACWHTVIPHLCAELPKAQRDALAYGVKVPIVYTSVLLRNWTSFVKLGISGVYAPGSYHSSFDLSIPVNVGDYQFPRNPEDTITVHMTKTPCAPGLAARDQHRAGRTELLSTTFETFERRIRDQMARTLGGGGFDPAADILAITVNRWPHGYAYQYNSLFDTFWLHGAEAPCAVARRPFGRIAIANADSEAYSYTDAALDHAERAVREVLALKA